MRWENPKKTLSKVRRVGVSSTPDLPSVDRTYVGSPSTEQPVAVRSASSSPQLWSQGPEPFAVYHEKKGSLQLEEEQCQRARGICDRHNLTRVVIPGMRIEKIKCNKLLFDVLIKEKVPSHLISNETTIKCGDKALKELIRFALIFGYSDISPLNVIPTKDGEKVFIVDFDFHAMRGGALGLFGWEITEQQGLCDYIPKSKHRLVFATAKESGLAVDDILHRKWKEEYEQFCSDLP
ncbi:MAG: hypothetical protein K1000chlam4_00449 [Chlamydiae bacterium]|nr:hypothetical protein [Chlamydiota bacterium]